MGGSLRVFRLGAGTSRFLFVRRFFGALLVSLLFCELASAQIGESRRDLERRQTLAEAWAPVIFQDMSGEGRTGSLALEPSDALVDLFFFDSESVKDNAEAVFLVPQRDWENVFYHPPVYFSVIESDTHFYINYFLYHAVDTNTTWHQHDTEGLWMVVRKDSSPMGVLEGVVTNAHGRPMIYGVTDEFKRAALRNQGKGLDREFMKYLDRRSVSHQSPDEIEFVDRANSRSFKAFVAARSHAIYKFSSKGELGDSVIYYPRGCGDCVENVRGFRRPQIEYGLVDFDLVMDRILVEQNFNSRVSSSDDGAVSGLDLIFVSDADDPIRCSPKYRGRDLPNYLAPAWDDPTLAANLFFVTSFKTPFTLADPASVHAWLLQSEAWISAEYSYNFYLTSTSRHNEGSPSVLRRASIWGIASRLFERAN